MKNSYPKPTPTQRVRHSLYWVFLAITFIPFIILYGAGVVAEFMDEFLGTVRVWCFQERYVRRIPRRER